MVQHCPHCTDGREFETQSKPLQCLWTHRQVCGSKRHCCHADLHTVSTCHPRGESEDHTDEKACKNGSTLGLNPGQISPKVQNRGISGPTKRTYVLQKKFFPPKIKKNNNKHLTIIILLLQACRACHYRKLQLLVYLMFYIPFL